MMEMGELVAYGRASWQGQQIQTACHHCGWKEDNNELGGGQSRNLDLCRYQEDVGFPEESDCA